MKKSISLGLVAASVVAASVGGLSCNGDGGTGATTRLKIFHTNDMHSHLRAAKADPFGLGGLARLSTLLKTLRKDAQASITVDAGDWSEGTWYFAVDAGANMLKFMSKLGYDAACLGNHDFLIGPDELIHQSQVAGKPFPLLAANLDMSAYPKAAELKAAIPATTIKEVGGLKIGMIGLTTYELLYNSYVAPVAIVSAVDAATREAKALRSQVDVLLIVSHNSFDMNKQIAEAVPGVDAVISGHSHRKVPQAVLVANAGRQVPVVETGEWAKFLGELELDVTPINGQARPMVKYAGYGLHPVSPDLEEDPEIVAMIEEQDQLLIARHGDIHKPIAEADFDLIQEDNQESALGNLAVKAYKAATGAELALEEISLTGVSVAKGQATVMDAHDVVPHIYDRKTGREWAVRVWNARGQDLALIFNVFYTVDGLMPLGSPLGWLAADGAVVTWDSSARRVKFEDLVAGGVRSGARGAHSAADRARRALGIPHVTSITIGGVPLDQTRRYKVALSDGFLLAITLASKMLSLNVDLSDVQDSGIDAWKAVVDYVAQKGRLTIADFGIGGHSFTQGPDAAVFAYGMLWDGVNLSVQIQNQGLKASAPGTLKCSTGLRDDSVAYKTSLQKWAALPNARVPKIDPGAEVVAQVPWTSQGLAAGRWPVECVFSSNGDAYLANNTAQKVFTR